MLKRVSQNEPEVTSLNLVDAFERHAEDLSVGRDTTSVFTLKANRCPLLISRYHATLRRRGGNLELEDLNSTNGT